MNRRVVAIAIAAMTIGLMVLWLAVSRSVPESPEETDDGYGYGSSAKSETRSSAEVPEGTKDNDSQAVDELDFLPFLEALSSGDDIFEALDQRAWLSDWSEQELGQAMAFWAVLCGPILDPDDWRARRLQSLPVEQAERLCRSYAEGVPELVEAHDPTFMQHYRQGMVVMEVIARRLHETLQPIEKDRLMRQLREALDDVRFERVRDVVWALHVFDMFDRAVDPSASTANTPIQTRPVVSTMVLEATSSRLMCRRIGGCGRNHPLSLRFCSIDPERTCVSPASIDEAIADSLMGSEIRQVDELFQQIERGLALVER